MILNVQMDMADRICSYMFTAKFPFAYEDEHTLEILHRGIDILNGVDLLKEDELTKEGWEMYRYLLQQANKFLIQDVTINQSACAEEIADGILEEYSDGEGDSALPSELKRLASNLRKCRGICKRANYGSKKHSEYTEKIAQLHSQIMQYDFENGDEILFDADAAYVIEWEERKTEIGEGTPTDLDKVKIMTKAYIRNFAIQPNEFGNVNHPVTAEVEVHHPNNPRYGLPKSNEVVDTWHETNKEFLDLTDPADLEIWYAAIDERIDRATSIEKIYLNIIRGNWLDSWMGCVKEYISFADRIKISSAIEDHIKRAEQERERLFGKK